MVKKVIILILITSALLSCSRKNEKDLMEQEKNNNEARSYLALGDSYTIGESVDYAERWPVQLADTIGKITDVTIDVEIIARTGWTTGDLINALDEKDPAGPYDHVSLLIGVNNQYQGRDTAEYRNEFVDLLQTAIKLAGNNSGNVLVLSIPDYGVTPFAVNKDSEKIAREIDVFNAINLEETLKTEASYVNVTPVSRMAADDSTLIAKDGLHPSGKMYSEWVKLAVPVVIEVIEKE